VRQSYGQLPLSFEANLGQTDAQVQFLARAPGYTVFLTGTEAVMTLGVPATTVTRGPGALPNQTSAVVSTGHGTHVQPSAAPVESAVLRMQVVGANPAPRGVGLEERAGKINYFVGNDLTKWQANVPTFARVEYQGVYPGIDLVYYGNQRQLEYDFTVTPGADPSAIRLSFAGAQQVSLDRQGDLVLQTPAGAVREPKPFLYQQVDGVRQQVSGQFVLRGQEVGFDVGAYDKGQPLVIDPVLSYSTYLGGSGDDSANGIRVDASGNVYVTGTTSSLNFPTRNPIQGTYGGGVADVFVTKFNPSTGLVYSTYLGGSGDDEGNSIAIDSGGNVYAAGSAGSTNFPTTAGAFQRTFGGGDTDAFVTKLNATGSLVYSTYVGGSFDDAASGIDVDSSGNAYISGNSTSLNFPATPTAFQRSLPGVDAAIVAKLNASGSALVYATYLGGTQDPITGNGGDDFGAGITVDAGGNAYLTGATNSVDFPTTAGAFQRTDGGGSYDAFVTKVNLTGSALAYSTYLGGDGEDFGSGIALDSSGNAYATGTTDSATFPTTPGAFQPTNGGGDSDAFLSKINPTGSGLVYSTYLGGAAEDDGNDVAVDAQGNAYVTGTTASANFPAVNPVQPTLGGGFDAFVTKVNPAGSGLAYSTFLGGSGDDGGHAIGLDSSQSVYVAGSTASTNFSTTPAALQTAYGGGLSDAFIAKIVDTAGPATHFSVSPSTGNPVAGTPFSITVTALRDDGSTATDYSGTVHFSSADPYGATLPTDYAFTTGDAGIHTFTGGATLYTAGTWNVTATDTVSGITGSANVNVVAAPAVQFLVIAPPSATAGVPFDVTVTAQDPYGNTDTNYQGTIAFSTMDPSGGSFTPAAYTFQPTDMGTATFPGGATLFTLGTWDVTATDTTSGITGSAFVTVSSGPDVPGRIPPGGICPSPVDCVSLSPRLSLGQQASLPRQSLVPLSARAADRIFAALAKGDGGFVLLVRRQGSDWLNWQ
jgi:hypothetical protein